MYWLVRLTFKKALSTGEHDLTGDSWFDGQIHADTLFSALINQLVKLNLHQDTNEYVDTLVDRLNSASPPFLLSSAFPFLDFDYYLPTPLGADPIYQGKLKNIPFLQLADFIEIQKGNYETIDSKWDEDLWKKFWSTLSLPRISLDRRTVRTALYEVQGNYFVQGSGLYFLIKINDPKWESKLHECISLLSYEGIGADRSLGYGHFNVELIKDLEKSVLWQKILYPGFAQRKYMTLSPCCPENPKAARSAEYYKILTRKGWILSNSSAIQSKRRTSRMFSEGSIFNTPCKGQVANVTPGDFESIHKVYRYGLGFYLELCRK